MRDDDEAERIDRWMIKTSPVLRCSSGAHGPPGVLLSLRGCNRRWARIAMVSWAWWTAGAMAAFGALLAAQTTSVPRLAGTCVGAEYM